MTHFYRANPKLWSIIPYAIYNRIEIAFRCPLKIDSHSVRYLKQLPKDAHIIVVANHADEMDLRVLMELARRFNRRFRFMVNAEAFEEMKGFAGFWMTRVGFFSVERGASDTKARTQAMKIIESGTESLVMFPEGEIHYLNDQVQRFKTGAVRLGIESLIRLKKTNPEAAVYLLPIGIKYAYTHSIDREILKRLSELEKKVDIKSKSLAIQERLNLLMSNVVSGLKFPEQAQNFFSHWSKLGKELTDWRLRVLSDLEGKYSQLWDKPSQQLMDRANQLAAKLRSRIDAQPRPSRQEQQAIKRDLNILKRTIWFAGWSPQYHMENPTVERLAESVIKLEREIRKNPRPKPLGRRRSYIQMAPPINLSLFLDDFQKDSHETCRQLSTYLRDTVQSLVEQKEPREPVPRIVLDKEQQEAKNFYVYAKDGQKVFLDHYKRGYSKLVVIAHGFFNSKSAILLRELAVELSRTYDVAVLDFRGHGQSPGRFYWTTKEYLDLEAVIDHFKPSYESLGLIGFSLGAATSIITASRSDKIQTLIAVSPPTEFERIEYHFWELNPDHDILYNLVGDGRYGKGVRPGPFWLKKDKPITCIPQVKASTMFLHGSKDWLIRASHSKALFEAAGCKKKLAIINGGPHAEYLLLKNRTETLKHILSWLEETL